MPTQQEMEELISFLPRLYVEGFSPIEKWGGGEEIEDGVFTMPWPEYNSIVEDFFRLASKECWTDYEYIPHEAWQMLNNEETIKNANLAQIKKMLTFCVRGERFCSGHWSAMIEHGHIQRLLQRVVTLGS